MSKPIRAKKTGKVHVSTVAIDEKLGRHAEKVAQKLRKRPKSARRKSGGGWSKLDQGMEQGRRARLFG